MIPGIHIKQWMYNTFGDENKDDITAGQILESVFIFLILLAITVFFICIIGSIEYTKDLSLMEYFINGLFRITVIIVALLIIVVLIEIMLIISNIKIISYKRYNQEPYNELLTIAQGINNQENRMNKQ